MTASRQQSLKCGWLVQEAKSLEPHVALTRKASTDNKVWSWHANGIYSSADRFNSKLWSHNNSIYARELGAYTIFKVHCSKSSWILTAVYKLSLCLELSSIWSAFAPQWTNHWLLCLSYGLPSIYITWSSLQTSALYRGKILLILIQHFQMKVHLEILLGDSVQVK